MSRHRTSRGGGLSRSRRSCPERLGDTINRAVPRLTAIARLRFSGKWANAKRPDNTRPCTRAMRARPCPPDQEKAWLYLAVPDVTVLYTSTTHTEQALPTRSREG